MENSVGIWLVIMITIIFAVLFFFIWSEMSNDNLEKDEGELGSLKANLDSENLEGELGTAGPVSSDAELVDEFPDSEEFHWPHMPLLYSFDNCSDVQLIRLNQAMDYIKDKTGFLSFEESDSNYDILFECSSEQMDRGFIAGEAKLNYYVDTNLYAPSSVFIYYSQHCINRRPTIEIHEIMHVFGLGHSEEDDWNNVMNPYATRCEAEISDSDLEYLSGIYG